MFKIHTKRHFLATCLLLAVTAPFATSAMAQTSAPDSNLYTTYSFDKAYTYAYLVVCGSTQESEGCYGSATLGPFSQAGAIVEGNPSVDPFTGTVTRDIYVVDQAANGGTGVTLYDYVKTDVVDASSDSVKVSLKSSTTLPLTGGSNAKTYLAADNNYLFIGTDQGPFALQVQKSDLTSTQIASGSPPANVSSITSDAYGFVTVTFGAIGGSSDFYVFNPDGKGTEDGGGVDYMVSSSNGLMTTNLATTGASPASRMQIRLKKISSQSTQDH
jgi:hypothetical protein